MSAENLQVKIFWWLVRFHRGLFVLFLPFVDKNGCFNPFFRQLI